MTLYNIVERVPSDADKSSIVRIFDSPWLMNNLLLIKTGKGVPPNNTSALNAEIVLEPSDTDILKLGDILLPSGTKII